MRSGAWPRSGCSGGFGSRRCPSRANGLRNVVISVEENAATTDRLRRRRRGRPSSAADDDAEGTAVEQFEFAPRGFFEVGPPQPVGQEPQRQPVLARQPPARSRHDRRPRPRRLRPLRVSRARHVPRAQGVRPRTPTPRSAAVIEQAIRTSFSYRRRGVNADLSRRLARNLTVGARYNYSYTNVYEDRSAPEDEPLIDRLFPQVRLSVVAGLAAWDTRDDPIEPTRGHLVGIETDLATRALGSEVGYSKTFTQAFIYRQLPGTRMVFAGGARLGLAWGFAAEAVDENGNPIVDENGQPASTSTTCRPASASTPAATPPFAATRSTASGTTTRSTRTGSRSAATPSSSSTGNCGSR